MRVLVSIFFQPADEIAAIAGDSVEEVLEVSGIVEQDAALEPGPQPKYLSLSPKTRPGYCA